MPLGVKIQTLLEYRNVCSRALGYTAFSDLDTIQAAVVNDALGFTLDNIAFEAAWKWAEREGRITTTPGFDTGTVTVTNLSATVTGAGGTTWNTASAVLPDDKFNAGEDGFYRILSVETDTSLTLKGTFAGTTAAGQDYSILRDEYDMDDGVLELLSVRMLDPARTLTVLSPTQWEELTNGDLDTGEPQFAMLVGADQSEVGNVGTNQKLQFWPLPDATYPITYTYRTLLTFPSVDGDNLETGPHLSALVFYRAMSEIYRRLQEPERSVDYQAQYEQLLKKVKASDLNRTNKSRHMSMPQWPRDRNLWPIGWPDVTNL
ncbi:MAG: hypothetical protein V3S98_01095 [Dehalococcoidia bacterium]